MKLTGSLWGSRRVVVRRKDLRIIGSDRLHQKSWRLQEGEVSSNFGGGTTTFDYVSIMCMLVALVSLTTVQVQT